MVKHVHDSTCIGSVQRSKSGMHMWAIDCVKVDARVEALETELDSHKVNCGKHEGRAAALEAEVKIWAGQAGDFEKQVFNLKHVLRTLGHVYATGDTNWHYFACPSRHGSPDCDKKCLDAQVALEGTK